MTGLKGYGLYAGAEFMFGNDSLQTMAYWHDYKTDVKDTGGSVDGSSAGIAAPPSSSPLMRCSRSAKPSGPSHSTAGRTPA